MTTPYQTIHSFFDSYGFVHARSILQELVKKADSGKSWNRSACCDVLFFSEKLTELIEAVFHIVNTYNHRPEIILEKASVDDIWLLKEYETYCAVHLNDTPWDFFPRHLSKKEFLDPYRTLEKFTRFGNIHQWKKIIKELVYHALSDVSMDEFDNSKSLLRIYINLNKLLEAAHLMEVRILPDPPTQRRKWEKHKVDAEEVNSSQPEIKTETAITGENN